ncbi:diphthine synthase [archaeon CG10_big_fil_rev_8_21_14_0_10_43_11]|nr:MAG: diphthine synthase [archaeon CG10_big_fil_rev_8_21_14_0_10_43_11]
MLVLVGLGLASEKDLTIQGIEALNACTEVYLEAYTGSAPDLDIQKLERTIGKTVALLGRGEVESTLLIELAKKKRVGLIVVGDPLCATTHEDLQLEARAAKIGVRVIHNASILSAIGEVGLQMYKFGKTISIPFWQDTFKPTSFLDILEQNRSIDAHTLVLLDLDVAKNTFMQVSEALERLLLDKRVTHKTKIVVVSRLGSAHQKIVYAPISVLMKKRFIGPNALIIPGTLHFREEESLEAWA